MLERGVGGILINEEQLAGRIKELGDILTEEYAGKNPLFICPLKGSVMFFADLLRKIKIPVKLTLWQFQAIIVIRSVQGRFRL